jgi:hypothetical protein
MMPALAQHHDHAFPAIEEAYAQGEISFEEQLLFKFRAVFKPERLDERFVTLNSRLKCLTPTIADFEKSRSRISESVVSEIESYLQPTAAGMAEYISPSGLFTITYETSGSNAVPLEDANSNGIPDYVEEAGIAADSSYQHEIINLGNTDPIPAGERYSILLADIGPYGFTQREFGGSVLTSIVVENDFVGFPENTDPDGDQLGALRVTIAHELKHAIQYADNEWSGETDRWLEMDATLMEEVVYDEVNDYYNYIFNSSFGDPIFLRPNRSVIPGSYEDITFALYFHERFGERFWTDVWTIIRNNPDIEMLAAVQQEVENRGAGWIQTLSEVFLWHYASGAARSPADYGFDEREFYPDPLIEESLFGFSDQFTTEQILAPVSTYFYDFIPGAGANGSPKVNLSHTLQTVNLAVIGYFDDGRTEVQFQSGSVDGSTELFTGWDAAELTRMGIVVSTQNSSFAPSDRAVFSLSVDSELPRFAELLPNFPNPFNPSTTIRFRVEETQNVRIRVYDITGRLVRELVNAPFNAGQHDVTFDATGLASGVYIYRMEATTSSFVRKMMLVK